MGDPVQDESGLTEEVEMDRTMGIILLTLLLMGCAAMGPAVKQPESVLDTPAGHYRQGMQKMEVGDAKGALADFRRAQKLDPEYAGTYVGFALVEAGDGKFQEAFRYLGTARKKDKGWIDLYLDPGGPVRFAHRRIEGGGTRRETAEEDL